MNSPIKAYRNLRTPTKYAVWLIGIGVLLFIAGLFDLLDLYEEQNSYLIGLGKALLLIGVAYAGFVLYQNSKGK